MEFLRNRFITDFSHLSPRQIINFIEKWLRLAGLIIGICTDSSHFEDVIFSLGIIEEAGLSYQQENLVKLISLIVHML